MRDRAHSMREKLQRASTDRESEGKQPDEVIDEKPCGTCVFGFMEQSMMGLAFRGVGMATAKANIAMTNLVYNMCRLAHTKAYHAEWIVTK